MSKIFFLRELVTCRFIRFQLLKYLPMQGVFAVWDRWNHLLVNYPRIVISTCFFKLFSAKEKASNRCIRFIFGLFLPFVLISFANMFILLIYFFTYAEHRMLIQPLFITTLCISFSFLIMAVTTDPGYLAEPVPRERILNEYNSREDLKKLRLNCHFCKIPRIARSNHCEICKSQEAKCLRALQTLLLKRRCVTKFECHSLVLNTCIGAGNLPYYVLWLGSHSCYLLLGWAGIFFPKTQEYSGVQDYPTKFIFFYLIIYFIYTYNFIEYFLIQLLNLLYNITTYEIMCWKKLPYLWKDQKRNFFNPFDNVISLLSIEIVLSFRDS
eukprot:TRINITY_DN3200_c0_g2_i4.p1 TRINITY_DN3200_c0_g2~~TRINITY_DN3200_c0_g2_i4.p1  ORF type:complete len:325 (+),score=38.45 TRINITY_DN3200_c0_g2_i4:186-1160(+)